MVRLPRDHVFLQFQQCLWHGGRDKETAEFPRGNLQPLKFLRKSEEKPSDADISLAFEQWLDFFVDPPKTGTKKKPAPTPGEEFDCFDPRVPKCGAQSKRCELGSARNSKNQP